MKRQVRILLLALVVLHVCSCQLFAGPSGINVLSQEYHVQGSYSLYDFKVGDVNDAFDATSNSPLARSIAYSNPLAGAYANVESSSALLSQYAYAAVVDSTCWASAGATAKITLQPMYNSLTGQFDGFSEYGYLVAIKLLDTNTGVALMDFDGDTLLLQQTTQQAIWGDPAGVLGTCTWAVDPNHTYELTYSAYANASYGSETASWNMSFGQGQAVPAPSALLLSALGAGLVGFIRRRI